MVKQRSDQRPIVFFGPPPPPPPTFLPLMVGGFQEKWFSHCGPHAMCQSHILPDPPHSISLTTYPPPPGTHLTIHQYRPPNSATVPHYPVTRHTHHTHWPINAIPCDRYLFSHHLRHNGHPLHHLTLFLFHYHTVHRSRHCRHNTNSSFQANHRPGTLSIDTINPGKHNHHFSPSDIY
jgi:hypothetical protein